MSERKEKLIEAAIAILNRDGADNLSMRTLARELNRTAASLYNHVRNKQDLFGEIAEQMCADYAMPDQSLPPLDYLLEANRAYRAMLLTVRDSPVVFEDSLPATPRRIAIIRAILEAYIALGVPTGTLLTVSDMVNNYVLSFVADERRFQSRAADEVTAFMSQLLSDAAPMAAPPMDFDAQFEYGLQILFAGIKTVINRV
ncbi:MAG: TetR/AcrR family transcriptional regulator C-terminal domain-containing protein [Peptococcaceae bacterium]|jgi:AcrR family transcriptional regulator|nr:TetR/AcrR family transcriptional regulator C-terminal domain-containing protein [Peptococcaceae bacterium]